MRTTIELSNEERAALLALAAKRGLRGYSLLVQEALAQYLHLPPPVKPAKRKKQSGKQDLIGFLSDGFSTGHKDASARPDDYIYRRP